MINFIKNNLLLLIFIFLGGFLMLVNSAEAGDIRGHCVCGGCPPAGTGTIDSGILDEEFDVQALEEACAIYCEEESCTTSAVSGLECVEEGEVPIEGECEAGDAEEADVPLPVLPDASVAITPNARGCVCNSGQTVECELGLFSVSCECTCCGDCTLNDVPRFFIKFVGFAVGLTGSLALIMFIYGGIVFLTSGGNSERVQHGRKILTSTITAIIILLAAWTIVNFIISALTGTPLDQVMLYGGQWWQVRGQ